MGKLSLNLSNSNNDDSKPSVVVNNIDVLVNRREDQYESNRLRCNVQGQTNVCYQGTQKQKIKWFRWDFQLSH
jgi:hypothetical protein